MTPEAQRTAIAEACYFKGAQCPDYPFDLRAMHQAEKILNKKQLSEYGCQLALLTWTSEAYDSFKDKPNWGVIAHATAAQRSEAFLRTLSKWSDS